jgi:hypothetical protein
MSLRVCLCGMINDYMMAISILEASLQFFIFPPSVRILDSASFSYVNIMITVSIAGLRMEPWWFFEFSLHLYSLSLQFLHVDWFECLLYSIGKRIMYNTVCARKMHVNLFSDLHDDAVGFGKLFCLNCSIFVDEDMSHFNENLVSFGHSKQDFCAN